MRTFTMGKITVVCESKSRGNAGFKHEATLLYNGYGRNRAKCLYVNRTWECYEYESVLHKVINDASCLTNSQKTRFMKKFDRG